MAGLLKKRDDRREAEIPTSSMADIAFLLLIFFLVTTTIDVDTGIGMTLPPKLEEDVEPPPVKERNILKILVNAEGQVLLEDEPSAINRIQDEVRTHVLNYGQDEAYAESPDDAVISIKTQAETPYKIYVDTIDEVFAAYNAIWDGVARSGQLPNGERVLEGSFQDYTTFKESIGDGEDPIREAIPKNVSIAEPDQGNQEGS